MTTYSLLPTQNKTTVIATWPGDDAESHSAKVTTFTDSSQAARLAYNLTRTSEAMWDAAAWLDTYDLAETALSEMIAAARSENDVATATADLFNDCRHARSWTTRDLVTLFISDLPDALNTLSRTQRLSVADELEADALARAESLELLPTGHDPKDRASRIWQAADITPATKLGLTGSLPDGAAGWVARTYDTQHGPAERWGARETLHRLEQLSAAADTLGARGAGVDLDAWSGPMNHLVLPGQLFGVTESPSDGTLAISDHVDPAVAGSALATAFRDHAAARDGRRDGVAIINVAPDFDMRHVAPWDRDVFAKLVVTVSLSHDQHTLATLDATDTDGFVATLGAWVLRTRYRA